MGDPITCGCYDARLIQEWKGVRNRRYPNSGANDLNCYKYSVERCIDGYWAGSVIFGTGRAKEECGVNIKQMIVGVTGFGSPKYSLRENGRSALQGIQVDAGWPRKVKICLDSSIDDKQTKGYISFAFNTGAPITADDYVSCPVKRGLPDFCSAVGSTNTNVYIDVSDDDAFVVPDGYDVILANKEVDIINNYHHSDNINNGIMALIAVLIMGVIFVLIKWVKPKWKNRDYDQIGSDSSDQLIAISASK